MTDELKMPGSVDDLVLVNRGLIGAAAYLARQHRGAGSMTLKLLREAAMKPAFNAVDEALVERVALAMWRCNQRLGSLKGPPPVEFVDEARAIILKPARKTRRDVAEEIFNVEIASEGFFFNEDAKEATIKAIEAALELPATED